MKTFKSLAKLKKFNKICLIGHYDPDIDALASMCVMADLLQDKFKVKQVDIFADGKNISPKLKHTVKPRVINPQKDSYDAVIMMDTPNTPRLGKYEGLFKQTNNKFLIDHHQPGVVEDCTKIIENISSTSEIVFKIAKSVGYKLNSSQMEKLYAGIITDTMNFTVGAFNFQTFNISSAMSKHIDCVGIAKMYTGSYSLKNFQTSALAINNIQSFSNGKIIVSSISKEEYSQRELRPDDMLGIANKLSNIDGCELVAFIYPVEDGYYITMRAIKGLDVSKIAANFGGGGHKGAAGFVSKLELKNIIENVVVAFENELKANKAN